MERLVAEEEKAGVSRYVISSSAVVPKQVRSIVEFLAEAWKGHPECISFGSIYPGMDGYEEVLDELQALGSRGLKIHPDFQKLRSTIPPASKRIAPSRGAASRC